MTNNGFRDSDYKTVRVLPEDTCVIFIERVGPPWRWRVAEYGDKIIDNDIGVCATQGPYGAGVSYELRNAGWVGDADVFADTVEGRVLRQRECDKRNKEREKEK